MIREWLESVWLRWKALFHRGRLERDLEDELAFHLAMKAQKHAGAGLDPESARHASLRKFGNAGAIREETRKLWTFPWIESLWQDLRYAARGLAKTPGFTLVVILSLALGIGANSAIFSVLNAVGYRPLPYFETDRLMVIWDTEHGVREQPPVAEPLDWNRQNDVFEDIASFSFTDSTPMGGDSQAEMINVQYATPNFFSVLRVKPILGRIFRADEVHDLTQTVVISSEFWKRWFHGDPEILGKTIVVSGVQSTIVGVMPPGFAPFYGDNLDLWYPIDRVGGRYSKRDDRGWLFTIGRLKPGVTLAQAQSEMDVIARRLEKAYPKTNKGVGIKVEPAHQALFGDTEKQLLPLLGAVAFVLLIGCVNVANLLLSRTETRRREYPLRASLGAARGRLIQQLLTESGLLAALGGVTGVAVAFAGIQIIRSIAGDFLNTDNVKIDGCVLLFTLTVSLITAVLFGLLPAIFASSPELNTALREGDGRTAGGGRGWARRLLAVAEIALAMVLLTGAGLMIDSIRLLKQVDPGFDPHNLMTARVTIPEGGEYVSRVPGNSMEKVSPRVTSLIREIGEKASALPGIESAATAGDTRWMTFSILGRPASPPDKRPNANYEEVSPSFFHTLRIPLKRGRYLDVQDRSSSPWVTLINESFARRFFPHRDPVGQWILMRYEDYHIDERQPRQIVGVVGDVRQFGPGIEPPEMAYTSFLQQPNAFPGGCVTTHIHQRLFLRTASTLAGREGEFGAEIKKTVRDLDPNLPVTNLETMSQYLDWTIGKYRFLMRLFSIFAGIALLLAGIGIYGVLSYFVAQRRREIGIRVALGAQRSSVLALVAGLGMKLTLAGVFLGIALALALTRLIARFLYGVAATDPATFAFVAVVLIMIAMLACYIPALRATRIDPMIVLRDE